MAAIPQFTSFQRSLQGTPMAGEARGIYNAAIRGGINPAFVAGLAGAESSYGSAGYARGTNNPFGLGAHLGWRFPNYSAATTRLAQTLGGGSYRGLYRQNGLAGIISRYSPASDGNDEAQHAANIRQYGGRTGGNAAQVYATGGVPVAGATAPRAVPAGAVAQPARNPALSDADSGRLMALLGKTSRGVLRGEAPGPGYTQELAGIANRFVGSLPDMRVAAPAADTVPRTSGAPGVVRGSTYGFARGGVDSGRAYAGGAGGDWGGSMEQALRLARAVGATPTSQKRTRQLTASGSNSDHWVGSLNSYAIDLPASGAAGDRLLARISRTLGVPLKAGQWNNVTIGGYRYNIGWKLAGHYNHAHVGVRRI